MKRKIISLSKFLLTFGLAMGSPDFANSGCECLLHNLDYSYTEWLPVLPGSSAAECIPLSVPGSIDCGWDGMR